MQRHLIPGSVCIIDEDFNTVVVKPIESQALQFASGNLVISGTATAGKLLHEVCTAARQYGSVYWETARSNLKNAITQMTFFA